jgi:hypothetical protein
MAKQGAVLAGEIADLLLPDLKQAFEESLAEFEPVRESLGRLDQDITGSTLQRVAGNIKAAQIEVERIVFLNANEFAKIFFGPSLKDELEDIERLIGFWEEALQRNKDQLEQARREGIPETTRSILRENILGIEKDLAKLEEKADPIRAQLGEQGSGVRDINQTTELVSSIDSVVNSSLTFEALVQLFGEAVARIDEASRRLADVVDRLFGPGGDAPEESEPGFERTSFHPAGVSGGAMALAPAGASAALMPADESFAAASRAVTVFVDESEGALGELGEFSERMFGELGDVLTGVLETGKLEWRDFARVAIDAIADILAEQLKLLGDGSSPGGGFFDLLGGILSGVLGGAFAHGGRPPVGRAALVGEAGPELFLPDVPGTIVPHGALGAFAGAGAAPTVITNFTIDARGAERGVERRIAEAMAQAEYRISQNVMAHILNNARRGGAFARMSRR